MATDDENDDSSSEYNSSDFEEVPAGEETSALADGSSLVITVPHDGSIKIPGRARRKDDIDSLIRRELNRRTRLLQERLHKVNLLCLLSVGLRYNVVLRSDIVLSAALSTLPSAQAYPPKHMDLGYIEKFIKWFRNRFKAEVVSTKAQCELMSLSAMEESLIEQLQKAEANDYYYLVCIFVVILRSLGVDVRLTWSLNPVPLKPLGTDLLRDPEAKVRAKKSTSSSQVSQQAIPDPKKGSAASPSTSSAHTLSKATKLKSTSKANTPTKTSASTSKADKQAPKEGNTRTTRGKSALKPTPMPSPSKIKAQSDAVDESDSDDDYLVSDESDFQDPKPKRKKITKKGSSNGKTQKSNSKLKSKNGKVKEEKVNVEKPASQGPLVVTVTSESPGSSKQKLFYDFWAEVYLEEEERWVSVDLATGSILCDNVVGGKTTPPLDYVLSFGNRGNVKDVTRRYAGQWLTVTQKRRVDPSWWKETLRPYRGQRTAKDEAEDDDLDSQLINQPVPKTVQELKGHPMYALERHLLKFEAIYPPPPRTIPLGFVNNEPIFPRDSIKTLHTKELWMRKAKVIRTGETPYKMVKSRPKYDRQLGRMVGERPQLELFGEWQTEDYIPMPAVNGKVPRNDYGNVELFQEKMLPGGTVHLRIPNLLRIARKLDIDCARAVTGFDFHSGACHPTFDGYVVCEEFKDILLDAYNQDLAEERLKESTDARVTEGPVPSKSSKKRSKNKEEEEEDEDTEEEEEEDDDDDDDDDEDTEEEEIVEVVKRTGRTRTRASTSTSTRETKSKKPAPVKSIKGKVSPEPKKAQTSQAQAQAQNSRSNKKRKR